MNGALDSRSPPLRDLRVSVTDRCNFRCTERAQELTVWLARAQACGDGSCPCDCRVPGNRMLEACFAVDAEVIRAVGQPFCQGERARSRGAALRYRSARNYGCLCGFAPMTRPLCWT
jgi:hypothetical protein